MIIKNKNNHKKLFILLSLLAVALIGLAGWFVFAGDDHTAEDQAETINLDPPSEAEIRAGEQAEQEANQDDERQTTSDSNKKQTVNPIISTWVQNQQNNNLEVNGFVSDVIEGGGTCTLTLTRQGQTVTESKSANPDAQTTTCGMIVVQWSKLSAGTWTAHLAYLSSKYEGKSDSISIEVN